MEPGSLDSIKEQAAGKTIQIIESNGRKSLLVKGQLYMNWTAADETAERMAIAQLYELGLVLKFLKTCKSDHSNSVNPPPNPSLFRE